MFRFFLRICFLCALFCHLLGAAPQGTVDAIVEAASLVTSLQTIVSRNKDPQQSGVLTVGTINGGYARNIIADKVQDL